MPLWLTLGLLSVTPMSLQADKPRDPTKKPQMQLSIALPKIHNQRPLPMNAAFSVVLTNISKSDQRYWRRWCSWGYGTVQFEVEIDGKSIKLPRGFGEWGKNYADAAELAPGSSVVFPIRWTDGTWLLDDVKKTLAAKPRKNATVRIRAIYEVTADNDTARRKVWVGKIVTPWMTCTFSSGKQ